MVHVFELISLFFVFFSSTVKLKSTRLDWVVLLKKNVPPKITWTCILIRETANNNNNNNLISDGTNEYWFNSCWVAHYYLLWLPHVELNFSVEENKGKTQRCQLKHVPTKKKMSRKRYFNGCIYTMFILQLKTVNNN